MKKEKLKDLQIKQKLQKFKPEITFSKNIFLKNIFVTYFCPSYLQTYLDIFGISEMHKIKLQIQNNYHKILHIKS